jgi:hypothetical protein
MKRILIILFQYIKGEDTIRIKLDRDPIHCRFYENKFPELEEVVMVNVKEIGEMGAYVTLLEYDEIEVSPSRLD